MRINNLVIASSALISIAQAAPIVITRVHTAAAQTEWKTFTTNTVTKIETTVIRVQGPPPSPTTTPAATPTTTANTEAPTTDTPTVQDATTETTSIPTTTPTTTSTPTTSTTPTISSTSTSTNPTTTLTNPTTTSTTPTTTSTTPTTTSTTPTTTSTSPTTTSTSSSTTSTTPTTTSTTPTTTSTTPTTTSTTPTTTSTTPTTTSVPTTSSPAPTTTSSSTITTSTTSNTGSTPTSDFERDILSEHNAKRALHGVQDLQWNNTLAQYAANYAANSFSCDNVQLIHSGGPYGENLAAGYVGGKSPVDAWYNEISLYDYSNPGFSEAAGHFTQVVWKSTSQLGCAMVTCNNAWRQYTICEYSNTRGNIVGTDSATGKSYFEENVLKPLSG